MSWKTYFFWALVIGGLAGSWIKNFPGFIILVIDKTSYEMRLWVAVCLVLLAIILIIFAFQVIRSLLSGTNRFRIWQGSRAGRKSRRLTVDGMLAYAEGRWQDSENAMKKAAKSSDYKLINYLVAAQAAQQQNAEVRRDAYLKAAYENEPGASAAIGLTQAQLQLQHNQFEQALASLSDLRKNNPSHPFVLKLLARVYSRLQEWQSLIDLLPLLKKNQLLEPKELEQLETSAVNGLLESTAKKGDLDALRQCWQSLPAAYRKSSQNIMSYAKQLKHLGAMDEAEAQLKPLLKKHADAQLIALYGSLQTSYPEKQLATMEAWQKSQSSMPEEAYLAHAKLAYNAKLWGKARTSLEQAMHASPSPEACLYLAKTLEQLDDSAAAQHFYQQGLALAVNPDTPITDAKNTVQADLPKPGNVGQIPKLPVAEK